MCAQARGYTHGRLCWDGVTEGSLVTSPAWSSYPSPRSGTCRPAVTSVGADACVEEADLVSVDLQLHSCHLGVVVSVSGRGASVINHRCDSQPPVPRAGFYVEVKRPQSSGGGSVLQREARLERRATIRSVWQSGGLRGCAGGEPADGASLALALPWQCRQELELRICRASCIPGAAPAPRDALMGTGGSERGWGHPQPLLARLGWVCTCAVPGCHGVG